MTTTPKPDYLFSDALLLAIQRCAELPAETHEIAERSYANRPVEDAILKSFSYQHDDTVQMVAKRTGQKLSSVYAAVDRLLSKGEILRRGTRPYVYRRAPTADRIGEDQ